VSTVGIRGEVRVDLVLGDSLLAIVSKSSLHAFAYLFAILYIGPTLYKVKITDTKMSIVSIIEENEPTRITMSSQSLFFGLSSGDNFLVSSSLFLSI